MLYISKDFNLPFKDIILNKSHLINIAHMYKTKIMTLLPKSVQ